MADRIELNRAAARNDVLAAMLFIVSVNVVIYQVTWVYAGPITAFLAILFMTLLNRRRKVTWRDLGLRRPRRIWVTLLQAAVTFAGSGLVVFAAGQVSGQFFEQLDTLDTRFGDMEGNLPLYLWWVSIGWVVGGFFEEMMFRGFLLTRIEKIVGARWPATAVAILSQAAFFAVLHYYYQGAYGALQMFGLATFLGVCYILFGRNLWPLILSHGTMNSLGFLGNYLGDAAI